MEEGKKNNKGSGMGAVVVGIAGAAIGAAAVALSDKKTRKKIGVAIGQVADQGKGAFNDLQDRVKLEVKQMGRRAKAAIREEEAKTVEE